MNTKERRKIAEAATLLMSAGVQTKSRKLIITAFDLIEEDDDFNWDYLDSEFSKFNELSEKGVKILYSNLR